MWQLSLGSFQPKLVTMCILGTNFFLQNFTQFDEKLSEPPIHLFSGHPLVYFGSCMIRFRPTLMKMCEFPIDSTKYFRKIYRTRR